MTLAFGWGYFFTTVIANEAWACVQGKAIPQLQRTGHCIKGLLHLYARLCHGRLLAMSCA